MTYAFGISGFGHSEIWVFRDFWCFGFLVFGDFGVQLLGDQGACACYSCFTWIHLEYAHGLACPPSLSQYRLPGFSSASEVYPPSYIVPPWVTTSCFLGGDREVELKPTSFSSFLLFRDFHYFLFSWPPSNIVPLCAACWGYSLIIYIYTTMRR